MKVSALLKGTMVIIHDLLFVVIKAAILLLAGIHMLYDYCHDPKNKQLQRIIRAFVCFNRNSKVNMKQHLQLIFFYFCNGMYFYTKQGI